MTRRYFDGSESRSCGKILMLSKPGDRTVSFATGTFYEPWEGHFAEHYGPGVLPPVIRPGRWQGETLGPAPDA